MKRAALLGLGGLPLLYGLACGTDPTPAGGGVALDASAEAAPTDAPSGEGGAPSILDGLDPTKGPFGSELAVARAMAARARLGGAGVPERAVIGGDPLFLAVAVDRVLHVADDACVNSPYGCPPRDKADAILGAYPTARTELRAALVTVIDGLARLRWVTAAHTAIAFANLLDGAGKLDPAAKATLAPKIAALVALADGFESLRFADALPSSYPDVKALYALSAGVPVPTAATAAAARDVVRAVVALAGPLGVTPGSYAPFSSDDAAPSGTTAALEVHVKATTLAALADADAGKAVDAYLAAADVVVLAAVQGKAGAIDWSAYAKGLDALVRPIDDALTDVGRHVPAPSPPPSGGTWGAPPEDRGTLEKDPRAGGSAVHAASTCLRDGSPEDRLDVVHALSPYVYGWSTEPQYLTPRRFPAGTSVPKVASIPKAVTIAPIPLACYDRAPSGRDLPHVRMPSCGVPIRLSEACYGKHGLDHVELLVRRVDGTSDPKTLIRHVYRPGPGGALPEYTWLLPRTDDAGLVKDAVNYYRVDVTYVTQGGTALTQCAPVYWVEGDAKPATATFDPCLDKVAIDEITDLLPDPSVPAATSVVQRIGGRLRVRPSPDIALHTGDSRIFVNRTGVALRLGTQHTPGFADATGLSTTAIGTVPALTIGDIADKASVTVTIPAVKTTLTPHRWAIGVVGADGVAGDLFSLDL